MVSPSCEETSSTVETAPIASHSGNRRDYRLGVAPVPTCAQNRCIFVSAWKAGKRVSASMGGIVYPTDVSTLDTVRMQSPTAAVLGEVGLPAPIHELGARSWDVIVVGAGHNGLACATYLARAGKRVLVLESRRRVGGACTTEEPFPGVRMSPCAYLAGLLHPLVVSELDLPGRGFQWSPAVNGLFVPFLDGSSIQLWDDDERCEEEIRNFAPGDVEGWRAMNDVIRRLRDALRPAGDRDMWIGEPPTREQIEARLHAMRRQTWLFDWSMANSWNTTCWMSACRRRTWDRE